MSNPDFDAWLQTPRGQYLLAWEQRKIDAAVADLFGFNAVQVGLSGLDLLRNNRMSFRFCCGTRAGAGCVRFDGTDLPFASQSIDLVLLPHVLEFADNPHQLLREVERVLVPEGSVVITGFNPYSLWGLRRSFSGHLGQMPWQGQYLSVSRLKDWLKLLGFETRISSFGCHAPPVSSDAWLHRWSFMDTAGSRWWPIAGGAYLLPAVKRVQGMRLIMPRWRESMRSKKAMVPVAQKSDHLHTRQ
ncbi:class I SAM-dependent methyltransferase [Uliginosibacterium sp. H1]|uniref:class I SAM-dependent methyltransferase n=1 Tax=Uliginosibacterium sp. H1 TaxID=3114757 RepID=UPI002E18379B|nr:class I SAM-dependent methyltransferase [Uliginosibacterium sp. H1]